MSKEQQRQPDQDDNNSTEGASLVGQDAPNQHISDYQTQYTTEHQRPFLSRIKDRINTHHTRALFKDPRAWIEIAALFTLGLYTYFASRQADAMNDTLVEIKKQTEFAHASAKAATKAANAAQAAIAQSADQFIKDQRPYIWLTTKGVGPPRLETLPSGKYKGRGVVMWNVEFTNYGRGPAHDTRIVDFVFVGEGNGHTPIPEHRWLAMKKRVGRTIQPHGVPIAPNDKMFTTATSEYHTIDITRDVFEASLTMEYGLILIGTVFYSDAAGNSYQTGFCLARHLTGAIGACEEGNYIK